MTDMAVAELGRIPMAPNLAATLSRATEYARAQAHLEVTLEHMLLALLEDPDAALVLAASSVDPGRLSADISGHLGRIEERSPPDRPSQLVVSGDLRRILEAAAAAAQQGRRRDINGAIVLAAVIGDGKSSAAHMLSAHGLTFEGAIRALRGGGPVAPATPAPRVEARATPAAGSPEHDTPPPSAVAAGPAGEAIPAPELPTGGRGAGTQPPPSMDDLLAAARERVRSRNAQAAAVPAPDAEMSESHPGGHEPYAHSDADSHASPPAAPAEPAAPSPRAAPPPQIEPETRRIETQGGRPASFEPQWMPASVPTSVPASVPASPTVGPAGAPTHAPAPQAGSQPPAAYAPTQQPQPRPQAGQPPSGGPLPPPRPSPAAGSAPPSGAPSGVHPHRPLPPDARLRPGEGHAQPPPPAPSGPPPRPAAQNRPATPPPQPATRPVHQPPPLPPPGPMAGPMAGPVAAPHAGPSPPPGQAANPAPRPAGSPTPRSAPPPPLPPGGPQPLSAGHGGSPSGPSLGATAPGAERRRDAPPTSAGGVQPGGAPTGAGPAAARRAGPAPGAPYESGQLAHNIPPRMRIAVPERIEVRIGKADVKALADGMQGGAVWRHEVTISKAMTVRLKAPDGGFYIESMSPETQWIDNTLGMMVDDFASWRWAVTPKERGRKRLQVVISARSVGADGMAAETALPDQIIEVQVRTNYARAAAKVAGWLVIALAGGALGKFGEALIAPAWTLISKIAAG